MKILYYTDNYAERVYGTKISLLKELEKRGFDVIRQSVSILKRKKYEILLECIKKHAPDMIWFVHSLASIPLEIKEKIKIPIVGFGLSNPNYFPESILPSYDYFVTNFLDFWRNRANFKIPVIYFPTACNADYHTLNKNCKKTIDVLFLGCGKHKKFIPRNCRLDFVDKILASGIDIKVFGRAWEQSVKAPGWRGFDNKNIFHEISGDNFINIIHKAKLALCIDKIGYPLQHRLFEYSACGAPVVTLLKEESLFHFNTSEMIYYETEEGAIQLMKYYLKHLNEANEIGERATRKTRSLYTIEKRTDNLLKGLGMPLGVRGNIFVKSEMEIK